MQKFKIQREYVTKKILEMVGNLKGGDLLPDYIELEGELLEGGMVGKCCRDFFMNGIRMHRADCHNKKENRCIHGVHGTDCNECFNRETPKEKIQLHSQSGTDSPSIQEYLEKQEEITLSTPLPHVPLITISKKEVRLPEMLVVKPGPITVERAKINEILTYLASKENK